MLHIYLFSTSYYNILLINILLETGAIPIIDSEVSFRSTLVLMNFIYNMNLQTIISRHIRR